MGTPALNGLRGAVTFLTRVPVGGDEDTDVAASVPWFPVVGALVGLLVASVYAGGRQLVAPLPAAAVAVAAGVLVTGAFHEDGLADTADAFGAFDAAHARRILKDPVHGSYGVCAIVLSLLLRVAALSTLGGWAAVAIVPAAHALARTAAILLLGTGGVAAEEGLGASYAARVRGVHLATVAVIGLVLGALAAGLWVGPAVAVAAVAAYVVGSLGARRLGGLNGDVLGAAEQVAEISVLYLGAVVVAQGWSGLPWWR
jgi:adenosylcobinamide-GDP ribazoletransferase